MSLKKSKIFLLFIPLFFFTSEIYSQKGQFISAFGAYQYTNLANSYDHWYSLTYKYSDSYYPAFGLKYTCNFTNIFGIETGIKYSKQGQKYTGHIAVDGNTGDTVNENFNSQVNLNYIQIPLMLVINSSVLNAGEEADKFYFSFNVGLQFEFLAQSSMSVYPAPVYPPQYASSDFNELFVKYNTSVIAEVMINFPIIKKLGFKGGIYASKTINNVENSSFQYDPNKDPMEYIFPVSTKKEGLPDVTRFETTFIDYGISIGLYYKFK